MSVKRHLIPGIKSKGLYDNGWTHSLEFLRWSTRPEEKNKMTRYPQQQLQKLGCIILVNRVSEWPAAGQGYQIIKRMKYMYISSVGYRWKIEVILAHIWTIWATVCHRHLKISGGFNWIRTHDLCDFRCDAPSTESRIRRNRGFSHDVTAAMLVFQNKGMAAMMVYQTNPPGIELYFYANTFFCFSNPIWLLVTWVKTLLGRFRNINIQLDSEAVGIKQ